MTEHKTSLCSVEYKMIQDRWLKQATKRLQNLPPITIAHSTLGTVNVTIDTLEPFFKNDACQLQESKFTKRIYATATPMTFDMNKANQTSLFWQRLHESPDLVLKAIKLDGKSIYDLLAEKGLSYRKATYATLKLTVTRRPKFTHKFGCLDKETAILGTVTTEQYYKSTVSDPLDIIAQYNKHESAEVMLKNIKKRNKMEDRRFLSTYSKFVITDGEVYDKTIQEPDNIITHEEYRNMCDIDSQIYLWWLDIETVVFKSAAKRIDQANNMGILCISPKSEWLKCDQL